jgi:simple sugar transport system permease protein
MGGFFAVLGSYMSSRGIDPILGTRNPLGGNPWIGILFGIMAGALVGLLHGYISISLKGNQIISGVAINVFALGGMTFFLEKYFNTTGHSPSVNSFLGKPLIPALAKLPVVGEIFKVMNIFVWLALILPFVIHFYLYHTPWGLRHRSVGEHPKAADTLGVNVYLIRYLATMIFGKWTPIGTFLASLFFTGATVLQIYIQTVAPQILKIIPRGFFIAFPYILTLLILAGFVGRAVPPAADGTPYEKGEKL